MNQKPTTFGEIPRGTPPPRRPNDLSDQAALTIKMANTLAKIRIGAETGAAVKLEPDESRVILIALRSSLTEAKAAKKAARDANERARRVRKR